MTEKTTKELAVGDPVPAFAVPNQDGVIVSSESLLGTPYLLYFYPKDNTPGCTVEACDFQSRLPDYTGLGFKVFGVSRDSQKSHQNFRAKFNLAFDLLSDTEEELCKAFDVIKQKMMYGKPARKIERSTFVIDDKGIIIGIFRDVNARTHVAELWENLKK